MQRSTHPSGAAGLAAADPPGHALTVVGVVLAGGRARRFGRDKALEPLDGRPMIAWSLAALAPTAARLAVNGPAALAARLGLPAAPDPADAEPGPLAGILGALIWARGEGASHVLTTPCDTPFLPPDFGAALAAAIGDRAVAAASANGPHPLCALWRIDLAEILGPVARRADQPPLRRLVESLGGVFVAFADAEDFANLNTRAEFDAAVRRRPNLGLKR